MDNFENAPNTCPNCTEDLLEDYNFASENGVDGISITRYCVNCENIHYDLGFQPHTPYDEDDDLIDPIIIHAFCEGEDDYDDENECDCGEDCDLDCDCPCHNEEDDYSLMYPNDTEEDAYDDAFDSMCR